MTREKKVRLGHKLIRSSGNRMYLKTTEVKFLSEILKVPEKHIYKFDNGNGTVGYRVTHLDRITRKEISDIEGRSVLFLREVIQDNDLHYGYLSAEFIKV